MKKCFKIFAAAAVLTCSLAGTYAQDVLKPKIVKKLQQNVFEVVIEKPTEDPLTYEKELPWDRIPYQIRNDKYDSIGTAFLLTDGHFYTAAHVLNLYRLQQQDNFFIRSSDGTTYKIGNIVKFATDRDFAIFDVLDFKKGSAKGLEIDSNPKINSTVFAVGNAQGEGIVMRNGLLTSMTPENRNGAWQWIRFSAAASPGNSGGPLVTAQGKVVGIVAMKNSSENLNYALPVSEIKSIPENKGELHGEYYYSFPNIDGKRFYHTSDLVMDLPAPIEEVRKTCYEAYRTDTEKFVNETIRDYTYTGKNNFVQNDPGSYLTNTQLQPSFPTILILNDKNKWNDYRPSQINSIKLENNGEIQIGSMLNSCMTYLKKPDDVSIQEYIENPKLLMDTLEKALVLSRNFGSERITITSFGEPVHKDSYTDTFGRKWIITAYNIPFADSVIYNYTLPLPDGIYTITAIRDTSTIYNGINYDYQIMSNFVIVPYKATFKQWKEYLSIPEEIYPRHDCLKEAVTAQNENSSDINAGSYKIHLPSNLITINDDTEIEFTFGLHADQTNGVKQLIHSVRIDTLLNSNDYTTLALVREYKPHEECSKEIKDAYKKVSTKTIPFNGEAFEQNQKTTIFVPDVEEDKVTLLGLVYQGSKMDVINDNIKTLMENISWK